MNKWFMISLGSVLGLGHIGMIGLLANRNNFPVVNLPVGEHTAYTVMAGKDGYTINYRANDPKVMRVERDVKKKAGFLGLGNNTYKGFEEYTVTGAKHLQSKGGGDTAASGKSVACIEAVGGGKSTGRLVGSSLGASVAPSVTGIPIVGWLAAGWITMFGGDQGSNVGGIMTESLTEECNEV
tara:strand:- start:3589 stop:4134 length:546 start_codon:yes stop_codon:yes gene_type:complete